jgi:putative transcriptional regulator
MKGGVVMSVYEGIMQGLTEAIEYERGKLDVRKNKLTIEPVRVYHGAEIKDIRNSLGMTQTLFADFMGVSPKTVEAWEGEKNVPNGPASRILSMVEKDKNLPEKFGIICR